MNRIQRSDFEKSLLSYCKHLQSCTSLSIINSYFILLYLQYKLITYVQIM